mmetsp:Transcript_20327/g.34719  ORF Transcript_20327/g.34719 Transcript_20327/m.34719 type:complete len:92 (+) Transcript_20327:416-691(+)
MACETQKSLQKHQLHNNNNLQLLLQLQQQQHENTMEHHGYLERLQQQQQFAMDLYQHSLQTGIPLTSEQFDELSMVYHHHHPSFETTPVHR